MIFIDTEVDNFFFNSMYEPPSILNCRKIKVAKVENF